MARTTFKTVLCPNLCESSLKTLANGAALRENLLLMSCFWGHGVSCVFKIFVGFVQDLGAPPDSDSPSPALHFALLSLKAGTLKCAQGRVKPWQFWGPPGLHTTAEGRGFQSHHQFRKTTSKRGRKNETSGGRGKIL